MRNSGVTIAIIFLFFQNDFHPTTIRLFSNFIKEFHVGKLIECHVEGEQDNERERYIEKRRERARKI